MIKEDLKQRLGVLVKDWNVKNPKRIYCTIEHVNIKEVAKILYKDMKLRLSTITGVDNGDNFELIYHFSCDKTGELFNVRTFLTDRKNPCIDTLCQMFQACDWSEREIHEMLGITFTGHPNLKHLLLTENWPKDKYPLRKDYTNE
ncbi:MAG: NADH-quinone oxidoreductase subunit C [Candidatus Omnitrophica bacterium]|nr:NADH-quinone oxidoreductase subunit C [Candidatus Omnitrophota bacterium]